MPSEPTRDHHEAILASAIAKLSAVSSGRMEQSAGVLTQIETEELRRLIADLAPAVRAVSIAPDGWDGQ